MIVEILMQQFEGLELGVAADVLAATLDGALVHLTKTALTINRSTTKAALDALKANYVGYAGEVITWGAPSRSDGGVIEAVGTVGEFRPSDAVTPNDVWAVYIHMAAGGALLFAAQLPDAPLPMRSALDSLIVSVRYRPASGTMLVLVS